MSKFSARKGLAKKKKEPRTAALKLYRLGRLIWQHRLTLATLLPNLGGVVGAL
jgi:hypothetical protein